MIRQYKDITFNLKRSQRKTASIYIERDGSVSAFVPDHLNDDQIDKLIEHKRYWIYKSQAEWRDLNSSRIYREFVNGEGFLYLGRSYRLRIISEQDKPLILKDGYFCLSSNAAEHNPEEAFKEFYRNKARQRIPQRVLNYQAQMGLDIQEVAVMELGYRWASCSSDRRLNFHWKTMMAPLSVIDYIVVHELAHLRYSNHTESFWNEVDKILPDYRRHVSWLRRNGAGMSL